MNLRWKRHLGWLVALLLIILALSYGFRPQPRLVDMATATYGPMQITVEQEGKTRVVDRYVVSAPVAGTACRVDLDVGDPVDRNQLLVTIRPLQSQALDPRSRAEAEARVSAAEASLKAAQQSAQSARAEADFAASELERLQPLGSKGFISAEALDSAATTQRSRQAALRSADFAVDVARHELTAARTALAYTGAQDQDTNRDAVQVRAPVTGRVLKIQQECEGVVNAGQSLLEIGDTRSLEIETDVLSADAVRIKPGMTVMYDRWGGEEPLQGRVQRVEPVGFTKVSALGVEEQRVLVISDLTSDVGQWEPLGDGYRVESRFILWEEDDVLQIPASALFRVGDDWAVFVVEDDMAQRRMIGIARHNGLSAQVSEGLDSGERVITHPDDTIDEGVTVKGR